MVLFSFSEAFDIIVMTLAIGFIFKDVFRANNNKIDVITPEHFLKSLKKTKISNFWYATAVVAPSIILHEFGHKFAALAFGMTAEFNASYFGLGIGVFLKLIGSGFLFFVPAYVRILGSGTPLQFSGISFAGPAVNLILWLGTLVVLKKVKLKHDVHRFLFITSKINMFLFIFNMLPIPGFDGLSVYSNLIRAIF